jgi:phosphonate transport system substrate-binding protein
MTTRRNFLAAAAGAVAAGASIRAPRAQSKRLRIGVGPLLPTPEDTKKAYTPVFTYLAKQLGVEFDLSATTDWAGMAVAMGSGQLDLAWMGPWGYIIANNSTGCQALATVKYDEKPTYLGIIIAKPGIKVAKFPDRRVLASRSDRSFEARHGAAQARSLARSGVAAEAR